MLPELSFRYFADYTFDRHDDGDERRSTYNLQLGEKPLMQTKREHVVIANGKHDYGLLALIIVFFWETPAGTEHPA